MDIGIEKEETLKQTVLRAKLRFFGHVMRSDGLEKEMMLAYGEGRRKQGRPRKKWMDEIHDTTGMNLAELRDATADRRKWRGLILSLIHISEPTRLLSISYAVFCLKKK